MIRRKLQNIDPIVVAALMATFAAVALAFALAATSAQAASGGVGPEMSDPTIPGQKAKLLRDGRAVAPAGAPEAVKRLIAAANEIENKPYIYGGGHGNFNDKGYDCSGAVSYALHGAGLLKTPLDSTGFMSYGDRGVGEWITIYAHGGHVYMTVAGLRWDTSGNTDGTDGPSWHKEKRSPKGFRVVHPKGL